MEFRDLKKQYKYLKKEIDAAIQSVINSSQFISGPQINEFEQRLADYVGVKHCITCGNGTDALSLAIMAWGIGEGDAVFVPDFTFFASGEIISLAGASPIFVDVEEDTFNISPESLEDAIQMVITDGELVPKAIVSVDLFGQPANYDEIIPISQKYNLKLLEDGAQGFGGSIQGNMACSFGDIATTSFFPAKPLGCYGDGGAIFTDDDGMAELLRSLHVHGKGMDKYDNVRIGINSRLDTLQAAILNVKLDAFIKYELENINRIAARYTSLLDDIVKVPRIPKGVKSSWAQYTILLENGEKRDGLQAYLKTIGIPSTIYYKKPMHLQGAFAQNDCIKTDLSVTENICNRVLSLPLSPYMDECEQDQVVHAIADFLS